MTDASNPEGEVAEEEAEAPEAVTEEVEAIEEPTGEPEGDPEGEEGEQEEAEEEIELNFGGDKLRVPKSAIPDEVAQKVSEFSKNLEAGYTKKFQAIAERDKSLEAREKAVEKLTNLNGETLQIYSRGLQLKTELEQLSQVDLNALWLSDPDQARRVSDAISQKRAEFSNVVTAVNQKETELTQAQQAELVRRKDEGRQAVEKRIQNFSEKDLVEYAVQKGIPEKDVGDWALNPVIAEMAWNSMMFERMQAKAKAKPKPAAQPTAPVKPMRTKGAATAAKDISKMSAAEMARHLGLPG